MRNYYAISTNELDIHIRSKQQYYTLYLSINRRTSLYNTRHRTHIKHARLLSFRIRAYLVVYM